MPTAVSGKLTGLMSQGASVLLTSLRQGWAWIGTSKDQLAIVFALVAGTTTLYQYRENVLDGQRKEALKYVDRSQETRVGDARAAVAKVFLNEEARATYDAAQILALRSPPNPKDLELFVAKYALDQHLLVLIEHYMNVAGCVKSHVCDERLACDFFMSDIEGLNNTFRALFEIVWRNRDGQNHMAGPMDFVRTCKNLS